MSARAENRRSKPIEKDESTKSYGEILQLALPVGWETVFQTSFGLIDQIIVGLLGASAVAGVGLANSISFIVMLVYSAIGTGSGVLIAQAYGRKDMEEVSAIAALGLVVAGAFGLCTALPLALFPTIVLRWVGAEENVANETAGSFQPFAASAPLVVITVVSAATFRSLRIGPLPKLGALGVEESRR
jgi:Na+-driven multidrug efflux pump